MLKNKQLLDHLTLLRNAWDVPALRGVVDDLLSSSSVTSDTFLALNTLLACCMTDGNSKTGLHYAQILLSLDPSDPFVHSLLGDMLFLMEDFVQCLPAYENALRLLGEDTEDANYFAMTNDVARSYFKLGRFSECRHLCDAHSSILESHAQSDIAFLMAHVQRLLLMGDLEAAEQNYVPSIELYRKASKAITGRNMIADIDRSIQEKLWHAVNQAERIKKSLQ